MKGTLMKDTLADTLSCLPMKCTLDRFAFLHESLFFFQSEEACWKKNNEFGNQKKRNDNRHGRLQSFDPATSGRSACRPHQHSRYNLQVEDTCSGSWPPACAVYCSFTNFRCVKISAASDHGAFGVVLISVLVDVVVITQCIFLG